MATVTARVETRMPGLDWNEVLVLEHTEHVELLLEEGRLVELDNKGQPVFRENALETAVGDFDRPKAKLDKATPSS